MSDISCMSDALLALTTVPDHACARAIALHLLDQKVAACINILPGVHSIYRWDGKIEESNEVTLFIKTTQSRYTDLELAIKAQHPYEVPELIAIPITNALPAYLGWVMHEVENNGDK